VLADFGFRHDLDKKFPFWEVALLDSAEQIRSKRLAVLDDDCLGLAVA
jgi:hypothetical protein